MTKALTKRARAKLMKSVTHDWEMSDDSFSRTLTFCDFIAAFMFVTRVVVHAEVLHLYPRILIEGNCVTIQIRTSSADSLIAEKCNLTKQIDTIFALSTTTNKKQLVKR